MSTTTATTIEVDQIGMSQVQAAKSLGVCSRTLRRWEKRGLIRGRRVVPGGVKLYPISKLRELVTQDPFSRSKL